MPAENAPATGPDTGPDVESVVAGGLVAGAQRPAPALEIGGSHVTGALIDSRAGTVVGGSVRRRPLDPRADADVLLTTVAGVANEVAAGAGRRWAVAVPAPFDYPGGVAWFAGVGKFESLYGVDVRRRLTELIDPAPEAIAFVNDADAFVLGEWAVGALRGTGRCAGLTLGTGVGSGFVVDGRIVVEGPGVPPEGSVHLLSIDGRPLEETVSRRAIRQAFAGLTGDDAADVAEIAALAGAGSEDDGRSRAAVAVLQQAFSALGAAVGPYLQVFQAEGVVIGGAMSRSWNVLEPFFAEGCARVGARIPSTVVAHDGEAAALCGAARHAAGSGKQFGPVE